MKTADEVRTLASQLRTHFSECEMAFMENDADTIAGLTDITASMIDSLCGCGRLDLAQSIARYACEMVIRMEAEKCPSSEIVPTEVCR